MYPHWGRLALTRRLFFNICIPTLTKEVVKKSQKTSVNFMTTLKNVGNKALAYVENALFGSANLAYTA